MNVVIIGSSGHCSLVINAAKKNDRINVVAIAPGCKEENMGGVQRAFPGAVLFDGWKAMLNQVKADVAVVNPWFCYHAEIAAACLRQGLHVYCEKPLATTFEQLAFLSRAWKESGRALAGMFNYRFSPWFLAVREAVDAGLIGDIRQIHAQKSYRLGIRPSFYQKRETMGGLIPWVSIHALDWAYVFGGSCNWVSAAQSRIGNQGNGDLEVSSAILLSLQNEVIATVTADYFRPKGAARHDDDRLRLTGTKGMMEVLNGQVFIEDDAQRKELPLPLPEEPFEAFLQAIESNSFQQWGADALYVTEIALNARLSADREGEIIRIATGKTSESKRG